MRKFVRRCALVLTVLLLSPSPAALSCSSCGSGAADPVILNPLEKRKLYLGVAQQSAFRDVDSNGDVRRDLGPRWKRQMEIGLAQRLSGNTFMSLVSGIGLNQRGSRDKTGVLDTSLNFRYTALSMSLAEPWSPQLQLMLSHRFKTTRSVQDAREENYLDSFGVGYNETFYGADLWFGMLPVMFGGSVLRSVPWETSTVSGDLLPGPVQKEIVSIGYMIIPEVKVMGGAIRERRDAIELDSRELSNSNRISHDLYVTLESIRAGVDNFRFTFARRASFGDNKNATQLNALTLAWMRTL